MADFEQALKKTGLNEGGLANNPNDHGGLTYAGIAYKFWPLWHGWRIVKEAMVNKNIKQANTILKANAGLQDLVKAFYKQNFWSVNNLGLINDQQIANNVYDCGVNEGTVKAAKILQQACGASTDGMVGQQTIDKVNGGDPKAIFEKINELRLADYERDAKGVGQAEFLAGWKKRLADYEV